MANRTDVAAAAVHGTNPQNLVEKITRSKIYNSMYWKEHCFALDAETVVDKAIDLRAVGGTFGGARNPSNFMCLVLKLLQIQPDEEVIREYILQNDSKYLRVLGAFYLRLTGKADKVYRYIEPLYNDMRRVRILEPEGRYSATHLDEIAEAMLYKDHLFDIALPRIPKRVELEQQGTLGPRMSGLDNTDIAELEKKIEAERAAVQAAVQEQQAEEGAIAGPGQIEGAPGTSGRVGGEEGRVPRRRSISPAAEEPRARLRLKDGERLRDRLPAKEGRWRDSRGADDDGYWDQEQSRYEHRDGLHWREGEAGRGEHGGRRDHDRSRGYRDDRDVYSRSRREDYSRRDRRPRSREDGRGETRLGHGERDREREAKRGRHDDSMSVGETNRVRAELGLRPLR